MGLDVLSKEATRLVSSGTEITYDEVKGATKGQYKAIFNGSSSVLTTGTKWTTRAQIPYDGTIVSARLVADQAGDLVIDIWKTTYALFDGGATHPVDADSITASAPPTLSSGLKSEDTTLTGWNKTITAGDWLVCNIDSVATITNATLVLDIDKTGA